MPDPIDTRHRPAWTARQACLDAPANFFPNRTPIYTETGFAGFEAGHGDNHGRQAKNICRSCPVRTECLTAAIARNEPAGIWGGAGGDERRWLRRTWVVDGDDDGPVWRGALAEHFARLDGDLTAPVDRNGPGATHGLRSTYARGCDCRACVSAARYDGVMAGGGGRVGARDLSPGVVGVAVGRRVRRRVAA